MEYDFQRIGHKAKSFIESRCLSIYIMLYRPDVHDGRSKSDIYRTWTKIDILLMAITSGAATSNGHQEDIDFSPSFGICCVFTRLCRVKTQIRILTLLHGIQAYMDCMYQLASILGYPVQEKLQSEKGDALVQIVQYVSNEAAGKAAGQA